MEAERRPVVEIHLHLDLCPEDGPPTAITWLAVATPMPGLPVPVPRQITMLNVRGDCLLRRVVHGDPPNPGMLIPAVSSIRPARFYRPNLVGILRIRLVDLGPPCPLLPHCPKPATAPHEDDDSSARLIPHCGVGSIHRGREAKVHYPAQRHPARIPLELRFIAHATPLRPSRRRPADSRCGSLSCGGHRTSKRCRRE